MSPLARKTPPSPKVALREPLLWVTCALLVLALGLLAGCSSGSSRTSSTGLSSKRAMLVYTAWAGSKHGNTQSDVAGELAASHPGEAPASVIHSEDCIACHSPLAVVANGGMNEAQALGYFFTTNNGVFTTSSTVANQQSWPQVGCATCHDTASGAAPGPGNVAYFNSATRSYQKMPSTDQLCGQCHGNLRFPGTDHLSYNLLQGTGGVGVSDFQSMAGISCVQCHMYAGGAPGSNSAQLSGHTWLVDVKESNGQLMSSCSQSGCHTTWSGSQAQSIIAAEIAEYQSMLGVATKSVAQAQAAMKGATDPSLKAMLAEAQHNLTYAASDESGGFHNHSYLMQLLTDANTKAQAILTALKA